jgi:hypothetical protein
MSLLIDMVIKIYLIFNYNNYILQIFNNLEHTRS